MATLVFDIETAALPLESFDASQREYLFRAAEHQLSETARQSKRNEILGRFNLWPFTAQAVCIAMRNAQSQRGQVLYLSDDFEPHSSGDGKVEFRPFPEEAELLAAFWDIAPKFDAIATFNGRGFDVPFLYLRSAILDISISRKDWLGYRFQIEPHCDLAEQLSFYGVSGREGAARRFNLDFYCRTFGIDSPKDHGVTGMDINGLWSQGRYREIAEYCLRDVEATVRLFQIWKTRLSGIK